LKNINIHDIIKIMKNFQPGGLRNRRDDIGGRPHGDVANYAPKNRLHNDRASHGKKPNYAHDGAFNQKNRAPREVKLFSATCTVCGRPCEVPFRPDGVKPVLCRDCFSQKNASPTNITGNPDRFTQNEKRGHRSTATFGTPSAPQGISSVEYVSVLEQLAKVEEKVSQILALITASEKLIVELPAIHVTAPEENITDLPTPKRKVTKKSTPKKLVPKKVVSKKVPPKSS